MKKMRVLHLIGSLSTGGAERNLYYLGPHFKSSRFEHSICCLTVRGENADELERAGVTIYELGYRRRFFVRTVLRLAGLLKRENITVLHTHLFDCGVVGRLAGWLARTPVIVVHEHGKTLWKKWYHHLFERLALKGTDMRIVVSEDIRQLRRRHEHTPDSKMVLIENAVDPAKFNLEGSVREAKRRELDVEDCFVVGTVGRLVAAKAFDLFLDVAAGVLAVNARTRFVIVGDGELRASLENRARGLGIGDKVVFLGKRPDIPEILSALDLYLITSVREGLPVSLIEAMMAAKPIVSSAVGGIPEVLAGGKSGVLVGSGERAALVEAVTNLMGDPGKREALGREAHRVALMGYSPEVVLGKLDSLYSRLIEAKGLRAGDGGASSK
jgi:glycosyltransferase involved in cell wall biosynthesis